MLVLPDTDPGYRTSAMSTHEDNKSCVCLCLTYSACPRHRRQYHSPAPLPLDCSSHLLYASFSSAHVVLLESSPEYKQCRSIYNPLLTDT